MSEEWDERLSAFLDGALAPEEDAQVREALASRPELADRLAELASVDDSLRALAAPTVPSDLHERLRARIAADDRERIPAPGRRAPPRRTRRRDLGLLVGAAAAAALALLLLPRGEPSPLSEPSPDAPPVAVRDPAPERRLDDALAARDPEPQPDVAPAPEPVQVVEAPPAAQELPDLLAPETRSVGAPTDVAEVIEDEDLIDLLDVLLVLDLDGTHGTGRG